MNKKTRRIISLVLVIALSLSLIAFTASCDKEPEAKTKAMILIHGILGGTLYDADTGEAIWCLDYINGSQILDFCNGLSTLVEDLNLDENGNDIRNLRVGNMQDESGSFTMLSMFEPLYNSLSAEYGEDYDIIVWQYDWRKSVYDSSVLLESFINDSGYEDVMFFTHSMGGNVVSEYLARSQDNRDKVDLFVPISTPFLGSGDAYYFLIEGIFSNVPDLMNAVPNENGERKDLSPLLNGSLGNIAIPIVAGFINGLGDNLPSIYMLSPLEQLNSSYVFAEGETAIMIDGVYVDTATAHAYFSSRDTAKKIDDSLKPGYANYESYNDRLFVAVDGISVHVSTLVNTHYIVGKNVDTLKSLFVVTDGEGNDSATFNTSKEGDGVVSIYSGTAGIDKNSANVTIVEDASHISIVTDEPTIVAAMQAVEDVLATN